MAIRKPREGDVLRAVLDYLSLAGFLAWRANTGKARYGDRWVSFGPRGQPDVYAVLPGGRLLAVEVKRANGGRLSEEQRAALDNLRAAGALAVVVRSVEELRQALRAEGVHCP